MGDETDLIATILGDAGAGTSPEKVRGVFAAAGSIEPSDEETALLLSAFQMVGALGVFNAIPDDPDQLDSLLLRGAELFLQLRSDDAAPLARVDVADPPGVDTPHPGGGHRASAHPDWHPDDA